MAHLAFSGSYNHSLDGKGRAIIPTSFREALGENFTLTINPTRTAVALYPQEEWEHQLERLSHINPMDKNRFTIRAISDERLFLRKQHGCAGARSDSRKAPAQKSV